MNGFNEPNIKEYIRSLEEKNSFLEKKYGELKETYGQLLTHVQHEGETVDHRQLRLLKSQNLQLLRQLSSCSRVLNSRTEIISTLETLQHRMNVSTSSSSLKDFQSFLNEHLQRFKDLHEEYYDDDREPEYYELSKNKFYYAPPKESVGGPSSFSSSSSSSSSPMMTSFSVKNLLLNQLKKEGANPSSYSSSSSSSSSSFEVPPFLNLVNLCFFEEKIQKLYKNLLRFIILSENPNFQYINDVFDEEMNEECIVPDRLFPEYEQERESLLLRLLENITTLQKDLVELDLIVPQKLSHLHPRAQNKKEKEKEEKKKDEFEVRFVASKVYQKFFRGGKKEYKKLLKSMIQCYRKQKNLWKLRESVLREKITFLESKLNFYKLNEQKERDETFVEFKEKRTKELKELEQNKKQNEEEEEEEEKDDETEQQIFRAFDELLYTFSPFDVTPNEEHLRAFLAHMKEHYPQMKHLQKKKKESPKTTPKKKKKKKQQQPQPQPQPQRCFVDLVKDVEEDVERMNVLYGLKVQKLKGSVFEVEERLLKEKMFMNAKVPHLIPFQMSKRSLKKHSRFFSVSSSSSVPSQQAQVGGKRKKRKSEESGHSSSSGKTGKKKKKNHLAEALKEEKTFLEKISKIDKELKEKGQNNLQKYALKKQKAREIANLKKVQRLIKDLTTD